MTENSSSRLNVKSLLDILSEVSYSAYALSNNDNEVLFATRDEETNTNNFYILNLDTMEYEMHMKNIHNDLCQGCINLSEDKIISVSRDSTFKVWVIKN